VQSTVINQSETHKLSRDLFGNTDMKIVSAYDELPLWSAPFGLKLLDVIDYKMNIKVLEIGCATGFPLIEIAQRLGSTSECYGIDPWETAVRRLNEKTEILNLKNIKCFDCKSEEMPFEDNFFNLIVSNNGINNVQNPYLVLKECYRTSKNGAQLVIASNLPATFSLFYECLTDVLAEQKYYQVIESLVKHINNKRKSVEEQIMMINNAGFQIRKTYKESFKMKFADATSFLNHSFISMAFKNSWIELLQLTENANDIINKTIICLNKIAKENGVLEMEVPFVVIDCSKS